MDEDLNRALNDVFDELAYVRAQLDEVLRRVPLRCLMCGLAKSYHEQYGDHDFTV